MANNCTCKVAPSCPMHGWKKEAAPAAPVVEQRPDDLKERHAQQTGSVLAAKKEYSTRAFEIALEIRRTEGEGQL